MNKCFCNHINKYGSVPLSQGGDPCQNALRRYIGSGEIESAHRYVIQIRLKIAGAWWKVENLSKMLALRVLRANRGWEDYWRGIQEKAP